MRELRLFRVTIDTGRRLKEEEKDVPPSLMLALGIHGGAEENELVTVFCAASTYERLLAMIQDKLALIHDEVELAEAAPYIKSIIDGGKVMVEV